MASETTPRRAGIGGTFYVVLIVFGLLIVIGVIVWMMRAGGGIKHSPQQRSAAAPVARVLLATRNSQCSSHLLWQLP